MKKLEAFLYMQLDRSSSMGRVLLVVLLAWIGLGVFVYYANPKIPEWLVKILGIAVILILIVLFGIGLASFMIWFERRFEAKYKFTRPATSFSTLWKEIKDQGEPLRQSSRKEKEPNDD